MCAIHEHRQHAIRKAVPTYITYTTYIYQKYKRTCTSYSLVYMSLIALCLFLVPLAPQPAFASYNDWTKPQIRDVTANGFDTYNLPDGVIPPKRKRNTHPVLAKWDPGEKSITITSPNKGIWDGDFYDFYRQGCPPIAKLIIKDPIYLESGARLSSEFSRDAEYIGFEKIDTTYTTDLSYAFKDTTKANPNIANWNVENVVWMRYMFENSSATPDVSRWDVGNVRRMTGMFKDYSFTPNVSHWDTKNVEDMHEMFMRSQTNPDVSGWNVEKVKDMRRMFALNKVANPDLSRWRVSDSHSLDVLMMFYMTKAARPNLRFIGEYNRSHRNKPLDLYNFFYTVEGWEHYYQPYIIGFHSSDGFFSCEDMKTFIAPVADFLDESVPWLNSPTGNTMISRSGLLSPSDNVRFREGFWGVYTEEGLIFNSWRSSWSTRAVTYLQRASAIRVQLARLPLDSLVAIAPAHALEAKRIKVWQGEEFRPTGQQVLAAVYERLCDKNERYGFTNQTSTASFDFPKSTVSGIENIDMSKPGIVDPALQPRVTIVFNDPVPYIDDNGNVVDEASGHPAFVLKDTIAVPIEVVPNTPLSISVKDINGFTGSDGVFTSTVTLEHAPTHANLMSGSIYSDSDPSTPLRSFTRVSSVQLTRGERLVVSTLHANTTDDEFAGSIAAQPDNPKNYKLQVAIDGVSDPGQVTRAFTTSFTQAGGSQDASAYVEQPNAAATHADTPLELDFAIPPDAEDLHFDIGLERPLRELTAVQDAPDSPWNMLMLMCAGVGSLACIGLGTGFYLRRFRQRRA